MIRDDSPEQGSRSAGAAEAGRYGIESIFDPKTLARRALWSKVLGPMCIPVGVEIGRFGSGVGTDLIWKQKGAPCQTG